MQDQDDTSWLSTAYSSMAVTLSSLFLAAAMSAFIKGLSRVRATYLQRNTWCAVLLYHATLNEYITRRADFHIRQWA